MKYVSRKWALLTAVTAAAVLAACGGGGGSGGSGGGGTNPGRTEISLRTENTSLPLNVAQLRPGIPWNYSGFGRESPYTTALTLEAKIDGRLITSSGDDEVFSCSLDGQGVEIGSLYYLDGKDDHMVDYEFNGNTIKIPGAYRSIALPSFGGTATFHFHGKNATAGLATITCTYTDPRDNQSRVSSVQIRVGPDDRGGESPSVGYISSSSTGEFGYLYTQGSQRNTQLVVNARVWNDLDQPVANPPTGAANLYARIIGTYSDASRTAQLRGNGATVAGSGQTIMVPTINGEASFSVTSGQYQGPILIEFMSDRADNNVSNGIVSPVSNLIVVYALHEPPPDVVPELTVKADQTLEGYFMQPFMGVIELESPGLPPHTWRLIDGSVLPDGLVMEPNGIIKGVPLRMVQDREFMFTVTDSTNRYVPWRQNQVATGKAKITIKESPFSPYIQECGENADVCELSVTVDSPTAGTDFMYALTAAGGDGVYVWSASPDNPIHGFISVTLPDANAPLGTGALVEAAATARQLACTPAATPGSPATLSAKSYDFVVRLTSAGITKNQTMRLKVEPGFTWAGTACP